MGKKYFIPALRHLWRYRLFTMLNILGMAISISACWIIFRIADYELGYDRGLPNGERIYRVVTGFKFDEKESYNGGVSAPIYQEVRKELNGLDYVVPVFENRSDAVEVNASSVKRPVFNDPSGIVSTDSSYFTMLPYRWVVGDKSTALNAPENVVLTETRAKKYFPGKKPEEIINSRLTYYSSDTVQRTITGIVSDLKAPTEFTAQEFCSLPTKAYALNEWTNTNGSDKLYLQLKRESKPDKILSQIENIVSRKQKEFEEKNANDFKFTRWYKLMPVKESHFSTYIHEYQVRKASKPVLYGLMGIGVFLLMLACINYVNMSIASMPQRAKEIGVRKTLGSSHAQLIFQFLSETLLTIFLGAIFADALSLFGFWILKDIIPPGVARLGESMQAAAFIFAVSIVVTVLAGFYPGWIITKVKTINVFRNFTVIKNYNQKFNLQKALIVFQFVIALVFITSAFIVGNQLHYALATDMGFDKDGVILVQVPWKYLSDIKYRDKQFTLFDELKKVSGIQGVSLGSPPMSEGYSSSAYEYAREGKEPISKQVFKKWVDTAYLNLYGMKLLAGRNLYPSDTTNELVINETAVRAFGFATPADAIGRFIGQKNNKYPIVGVIKDFHMQNFYKTIDPMALESEKDNLSTFNIKLESRNPSQWQATLQAIEKKWYQFYPAETFSYKFYDEELENMYVQERHLSKLINLATGMTIFISCLGLFGLAVLTAFQRTKEIGIRKVLGASVLGIVRLLFKEYLRLVILAIMLAAPISWWAMNKWLQDFAYRIPIQWWMFVSAGIIALLIALLTVGFHALKAANVNPVKSLRTE